MGQLHMHAIPTSKKYCLEPYKTLVLGCFPLQSKHSSWRDECMTATPNSPRRCQKLENKNHLLTRKPMFFFLALAFRRCRLLQKLELRVRDLPVTRVVDS